MPAVKSLFSSMSSLIICISLGGCGLPEFAPGVDAAHGPASGPTVSALIENLKCQLYDAATDDTVLAFTNKSAVHPDHTSIVRKKSYADVTSDLTFSVKNMMEEIEYIGSIKLTLDITNTASFTPSLNIINNYLTTGSNYTLALGGTLSDLSHRSMDLYQSVDFGRFVPSKPNKQFLVNDPHPGPNAAPGTVFHAKFEKDSDGLTDEGAPTKDGRVDCKRGSDLDGDLGLREVLRSSILSSRLDDFGVRLNSAEIYGQTPIIQGVNTYSFGQVGTQIDFTVTAGVTGGPNWTIHAFKGPIANGQLLNFQNVAKDTLIITIAPVCIRAKYFPDQWSNYEFNSDEKPDTKSGEKSIAKFLSIATNKNNFDAIQKRLDELEMEAKNKNIGLNNQVNSNDFKKLVETKIKDRPKPLKQIATKVSDTLASLNRLLIDVDNAAPFLKEAISESKRQIIDEVSDMTGIISDVRAGKVDIDSYSNRIKNANAKISQLKSSLSAVGVLITEPKTKLPTFTYPATYSNPDLIDGSPEWAHYLPSCMAPEGEAAKGNALGGASSVTAIQSLRVN